MFRGHRYCLVTTKVNLPPSSAAHFGNWTEPAKERCSYSCKRPVERTVECRLNPDKASRQDSQTNVLKKKQIIENLFFLDC